MAVLGERLRNETGVAVEVFPADLTLDSDVAEVEWRLGVGDIALLVNKAGMSLKGSILESLAWLWVLRPGAENDTSFDCKSPASWLRRFESCLPTNKIKHLAGKTKPVSRRGLGRGRIGG